jgi:hypothetical protein
MAGDGKDPVSDRFGSMVTEDSRCGSKIEPHRARQPDFS